MYFVVGQHVCTFLFLFFFKQHFYRQNCKLKQDSNSDRWSKGCASLPQDDHHHHHHHGEKTEIVSQSHSKCYVIIVLHLPFPLGVRVSKASVTNVETFPVRLPIVGVGHREVAFG